MPGFDSLAGEIAGSYTPAASTQQSEDDMGSTNRQDTNTPATNTSTSTDTNTSTTGTDATVAAPAPLPFGFAKAEDAATGTPTGGCAIPTLGGTTANPSATSCCQQCTIQAQQDNIAREAVCSTMKTRVETWFMENGCPIQIIPLTNQQQMGQSTPCQMQQQQYQQYQAPPQTYPSCSNGTCPIMR